MGAARAGFRTSPGAIDPATGAFVMLGKTFNDRRDARVATEELLKREVARDTGPFACARSWSSRSPSTTCGESPLPGAAALRARQGYRPDKKPHEADTMDTVRAIYAQQDKS
jgi:DNA ligase-1